MIAYSVGQRTQEIGIRIALGASAGALQASIILQTLKLAALGLLIGVVASWALGRMLSGLLFGVTATDPVTFLSMLAVLHAGRGAGRLHPGAARLTHRSAHGAARAIAATAREMRRINRANRASRNSQETASHRRGVKL